MNFGANNLRRKTRKVTFYINASPCLVTRNCIESQEVKIKFLFLHFPTEIFLMLNNSIVYEILTSLSHTVNIQKNKASPAKTQMLCFPANECQNTNMHFNIYEQEKTQF